MKFPAVQDIADNYGSAKSSDVGQYELRLFQEFGEEPLIPSLLAAFPLVRRASGRAAILSKLLRHSRQHSKITDLAVQALSDRAYLVREHACSVLAYSLNLKILPVLHAMSTHADPRTRADAQAAADAISGQNHHYYVDRDRTGNNLWLVG
jgi:hypothetical protein